ncbi:hypothetical protein GCM10014715_48230 [Streptomyces spiralis]|uniref:Uncharacterized protein n=1 Tax=Streptomyces spiralis TaxID=66376 RepID=A0A919DWL8_9ACTN|nr:hypothetical protein GCM10014715_48230 [Streptomyces spiralis]
MPGRDDTARPGVSENEPSAVLVLDSLGERQTTTVARGHALSRDPPALSELIRSARCRHRE